MIIVQADLLSAITGVRSNLGRIEICNDGTGTRTRSNYNVTLYSAGVNPHKVRTARVENWPRLSKSAFRLVIEAVKAVELEEKPAG